jgi:hypothetical protein
MDMNVLVLMTVIGLTIIIKKEYRKPLTNAIVNMIYVMICPEVFDQIIIDYYIIFKCTFTLILIILFILNWYDHHLIQMIYIGSMLTTINICIDMGLKLIMTCINIYKSKYGNVSLRTETHQDP